MAYIIKKKPNDPTQNLEIGTQVFSDESGNPIQNKPANEDTFTDLTRAREQNTDLDIDGLLSGIREQGAEVRNAFDQAKSRFTTEAGPSNVFDTDEENILNTAIGSGITPDAVSLTHRNYTGPTAIDPTFFRPRIKEYEQQLSLFGSPAGIQTALKGNKPGLTTGATRFDSDLYLNNQNFINERQQLIEDLGNLNTEANETVAWAPTYAEQRRQEEEALRNASRSYVGQKKTDIENMGTGRIQAETDWDANVKQKYEDARQDLLKVKDIPLSARLFDITRLGPERQYASRYSGDVFNQTAKPQEFLDLIEGEEATLANVLNQDEINRFNRSAELIDLGDRLNFDPRQKSQVDWLGDEYAQKLEDLTTGRANADYAEWQRREQEMRDKLKAGWRITDAVANTNWKTAGIPWITKQVLSQGIDKVLANNFDPQVVTLPGGERVIYTLAPVDSAGNPTVAEAIFNPTNNQWYTAQPEDAFFKYYYQEPQNPFMQALRNPFKAAREFFVGPDEKPMMVINEAGELVPVSPEQYSRALGMQTAGQVDPTVAPNLGDVTSIYNPDTGAIEGSISGEVQPLVDSEYALGNWASEGAGEAVSELPAWATAPAEFFGNPIASLGDFGISEGAMAAYQAAPDILGGAFSEGFSQVGSGIADIGSDAWLGAMGSGSAGAEGAVGGAGEAILGGFGGAATAGVLSFATHLIGGGSVAGAVDRGLMTAAGFVAGAAVMSAVSGMAMGAAMGSWAGPIGAVVGGIIGGIFGRVICNELHRQGLFPADLYAIDLQFGKTLDYQTLKGYRRWAVPYVELMKKYKLATWFIYPWVMAWAEESAYKMGKRDRHNPLGRTLHAIGLPWMNWLGRDLPETQYMKLYEV
jgi:hypothetical protein